HSPISKHSPVSKSRTHPIKTITLMMFALAVMVAAVMLLVAANAHPRSVLMVESTCDLSPLPSPKKNLETMSEKSSPDIELSSRPETFISMLT
ncbi:hypothetical protein BgiMline_028722, partial [Biomphalaria glabrata]